MAPPQIRTGSHAFILLCVVAVELLLSVLVFLESDRAPKTGREPQKRGSAWPLTNLTGPITVRAMGHELLWRFTFPGPDGEFDTGDDVQVENEVHLPLGRDIIFLTTSNDFVYTMAIPQLNLRQIAVPDLVYTLSFHTTAAGSFDALVDPLCSVTASHDRNEYMARVVIQSEPAFISWYTNIP